MAPRVPRFSGGWSVSDESFAIFVGTREQALKRFEHNAGLAPWSRRIELKLERARDPLVGFVGLPVQPAHLGTLTRAVG